MGEVSKDEVRELNKVFGRTYRLTTVRSKFSGEPKKLYSYNAPLLASVAGLGAAISFYGRYVKGYNMLWYVAGFTPLLTTLVYNNTKQPT